MFRTLTVACIITSRIHLIPDIFGMCWVWISTY